ncbi:MAG: DUF202 domain-containing protein [Lasallia pustulata]|uniref:DUF202 domain-containing protein n=1 Tax=Lasallia pustulata TaxID=136370 RepID=A0A5M8PG94_9LECA|nr:MAG: DUF202 domain-containing protein [Lasallia pustulata]
MADEEGCFSYFSRPLGSTPVKVEEHVSGHVFLAQPLLGPLLFINESSDARDHCANERTFLSWLKLSIYMAIVSVAILVTFHLKSQPTALEKRTSTPLGVIFWLAALASLANGFANYINTVKKYSRKQALVQSGWKTKLVFLVVSSAIIAACILFLSTDAASPRR